MSFSLLEQLSKESIELLRDIFLFMDDPKDLGNALLSFKGFSKSVSKRDLRSRYFRSLTQKRKIKKRNNIECEIVYEVDLKGRKQGWLKKYYVDERFCDHPILRSDVQFKNGKKEGTERIWHPKGYLWQERTYTDGKKQGEHKIYSPSGALCSLFSYKDDLVDGYHWTWDETGEHLLREYFCVQDQLHGQHKTFWLNGNIAESCSYVNGVKEGISIVWDEEGEVVMEAIFSKNKVVEYLYQAERFKDKFIDLVILLIEVNKIADM